MATILAPPDPAIGKRREQLRPGGGGVGPAGPRGGGGGGGDDHGSDPSAQAMQRYRLGTWIGLSGVVMLFAAFTSAMVVRRGLSDDWQPLQLPGVLWLSTAILLASSVTLEKAKRVLRQSFGPVFRRWLAVSGLLGAGFLAAQLVAWRQLADQGIYVASNPSSSFFYLLTAAHGLHLLGGLMAMSYLLCRVWRARVWRTREAVMEATALYWHFMDGLWLYLMLLLYLWG